MIHRLADGPCVLTIASVVPSEGKFGPQVHFSGVDGTGVYVNESPATRGLERLSLDMDTVIGKTIRFSQVKKDGKTFTNLDLVGEGAVVAVATATAGPSASKAPVDLASLIVLYGQCVDGAMATLGMKCEEAGVPYDAAALQSAAATLFIRACR